MRRIRGREIALVPQSPIAALNPARTIGAQFREAWRVHRSESRRSSFRAASPGVARRVSLPGDAGFCDRYPRELSVGLAQRVLIAMALVHGPALILADEPTSALDMITQSEILELLGRLNREMRNTAILYISHDLLSVATCAIGWPSCIRAMSSSVARRGRDLPCPAARLHAALDRRHPQESLLKSSTARTSPKKAPPSGRASAQQPVTRRVAGTLTRLRTGISMDLSSRLRAECRSPQTATRVPDRTVPHIADAYPRDSRLPKPPPCPTPLRFA